jgi:hypothetical protein
MHWHCRASKFIQIRSQLPTHFATPNLILVIGAYVAWSAVIFSRGSAIELDKYCVVGMPFQEFSPFFSPDELDAMTAAYNGACPQLMSVAALTSGDLKAKLARIILVAACAGKPDERAIGGRGAPSTRA